MCSHDQMFVVIPGTIASYNNIYSLYASVTRTITFEIRRWLRVIAYRFAGTSTSGRENCLPRKKPSPSSSPSYYIYMYIRHIYSPRPHYTHRRDRQKSVHTSGTLVKNIANDCWHKQAHYSQICVRAIVSLCFPSMLRDKVLLNSLSRMIYTKTSYNGIEE